MYREELRQLEEEFMEAVQNRDMAYLEERLGENFVLATGRLGAETRSRQEWLDVTRERYEITSFRFEWVHVDIYGDAAVVRSRYRQEGTMDGKDRSSPYLMSDVWVRHVEGWKLVTRHISPLEAGDALGETGRTQPGCEEAGHTGGNRV